MLTPQQLMQLKRIASRANPRLKDWSSLAAKKHRDELGLTIAEGARLCLEGLAADPRFFEPETLLIADRAAGNQMAGTLYERAGEKGVERISVSDDCMDKVSGLKNSDGFALILKCADGVAARDLFSDPRARLLVAAGVQDPGNAGALARTALAAGFGGCVFVDGADSKGPKFLRGSMGAAFSLPCAGMTEEEFVAVWPSGKVRLVMAASAEPGADYRDDLYAPPFALLVGGERGVPESLEKLPDVRVRIPLRGGVESLNLAVAAGIIMFRAADGGIDGTLA